MSPTCGWECRAGKRVKRGACCAWLARVGRSPNRVRTCVSSADWKSRPEPFATCATPKPPRLNAGSPMRREASAEYRKTSGEIEFFTDGTFVNTMDGWKEMRIGVFSKRKLGESASPDQWSQRTLPPIEARHVFAAIESADAFAARWPLVASRLGIRGSRRIDVVADGARWIWDRVSTLLAGGRRSARYLSCLGARGGHGQGACMAMGRPKRNAGMIGHAMPCWQTVTQASSD